MDLAASESHVRRWIWCVSETPGRGSGLGNELVPWARAYLMSQVLSARCIGPAFARNTRPYRDYFATPWWDWAAQKLMHRVLPTVRFTEADHVAHGGGDVLRSFAAFAERHRLHERGPLVVSTSGMWGGPLHVRRARDQIRALLAGTRHAGENLAALGSRLDPDKITVALHVRLGDFVPHLDLTRQYRNRFNVALPLGWFVEVGQQVRAALGDGVQFQVFSDGTPAQLQALYKALDPVNTRSPFPNEVSDLLALARADLLVCSVSSYSMWAAALSDAAYLWFKPQLHPQAAGWWSIWGFEPSQQLSGSVTIKASRRRFAERSSMASRAFAHAPGEVLSPALLAALRRRQDWRRVHADLVMNGVVPDAISTCDPLADRGSDGG